MSRRARARRRANRVNRRLIRDVPLLVAAGVEPLIDEREAALQLDAHDAAIGRHFRRLDQRQRAMAQRAGAMRMAVAALVSAAELAALDQRRTTYPASPEYAADMWGQELRRLAPATAATFGYHPIDPFELPVDRWKGLEHMARAGGEQAARAAEIDRRIEARIRRRAGGEQLGLGFEQSNSEPHTETVDANQGAGGLAADGGQSPRGGR